METGYAYGMRLRGFSLGCQPRGHSDRLDDPTGKYYDIVIYPFALTPDQMSDYSLDYIGKATREWRIEGK